MRILQLFERDDLLKQWTSSDSYWMVSNKIYNQFDDLVNKYPFKGGILYRGLNFSSPKEYMAFKRSVRGGNITSDSISSWSTHKDTAKRFATSKQVFAPTADVLKNYDPNEKVSGFIGVIVKIKVGPEVGIDVNKSGEAIEDEVILPPGSYPILEIEPEKKYKHLVNRLDINQEAIDYIRDNSELDSKTIAALFRYKGDQLLPQVKQLIATDAMKRFINTFSVSVEKTDPWLYRNKHEFDILYPDGYYELDMHGDVGLLDLVNIPDFSTYISPDLNDQFRKKVINRIIKVTKPLDKLKANVKYPRSFNYFNKLFGTSINDIPPLSHNFSNTYHRFNELQREWNKDRHFDMRSMVSLFSDTMQDPFKT